MEPRWELVLLVGLLGLTIIAVEAVRWRRSRPLDVLRLVGVIYLLAYVLAPLQFALADLRVFRTTPWDWLLQFDSRDDRFVWAAALGLLGYLGIVAAYTVTSRLLAVGRSVTRSGVDRDDRRLLHRTVGLGIVGTVALIGYTVSIGGIGPLLFQAAAFRTHPPVVTRWAFLKNIAPLVVAAAYLAAGLLAARPRPRWFRVLSVAFWLIAFVTMFHRAARLPLLAFLITIPLANALRRRRIPVGLLAGGLALFVLLVLFGKQLFAGGRSAEAVISHWALLKENVAFGSQSLVIEFSFPFISTGNALVSVPRLTPYRQFADLAIAPLYLIPQRLTGFTPPPTVSAINTDLLHATGTIPADVVTLGWFSLGLTGVLLVAVGYGAACALVDWLVQRAMPSSGPLGPLGVSWILFAGFASLYADPQMVLEGGFYLYIASAAVFMPSLRSIAAAITHATARTSAMVTSGPAEERRT